MLFGEHHESHAASAFYPSPFEEAAVVTMDGVGEWATSSIGVGRGQRDRACCSELRFPHSLGLLYSAFTYFTGFRVNFGRVQGDGPGAATASRSTSRPSRTICVEIRDDGSLWMNHGVLHVPARPDDDRPTIRAALRRPGAPAGSQADAARNGPRAVGSGHHRRSDAQDEPRSRDAKPACATLCLAGGVALNCVGNGRILREWRLRSDLDSAGGRAMPAARWASRSSLWHRYLEQPRAQSGSRWARGAGPSSKSAAWRRPPRYADGMSGSYLGPRFTRRPDSAVSGRARLCRMHESSRQLRWPTGLPRCWLKRKSSACSRAGWSSAPAPSAGGRSSATHARRRCSR